MERIIKFWKSFSDSEIRSLYNFIKHKGKPIYKELDTEERVFDLFLGNKKYPTDIKDVQKVTSIEEGIQGLIAFDNKELFPYLKKLIEDVKQAVNPSPMLM